MRKRGKIERLIAGCFWSGLALVVMPLSASAGAITGGKSAGAGAPLALAAAAEPQPPDAPASGRQRRIVSRGTRASANALAAEAGLAAEPTVVTPGSHLMAAHFIDVGQGDATLLEFPCGAVLIDTGGEENPSFSGDNQLRNYLEKFFDRRSDLERTLDLVVLSHPHIDHTHGVAVLETAAIKIRHAIDNGETAGGSGRSGQLKLRALAADHQAIREANITLLDGLTSPTIDPLDCGNGVNPRLRAVWGHLEASPDMDGDGEDDWSRADFRDENNHSVVLRVDFGESSFLFTGDIEDVASDTIVDSYAEDTSILDADVLKVPHHGSDNGISPRLLREVSPSIAVIQAGNRERRAEFTAFAHGHPRKQVVELLTGTEGVSGTRDSVTVPVATGQRRFTNFPLTKAVYSNGWDGPIVIYADTDGKLRVVTGEEE